MPKKRKPVDSDDECDIPDNPDIVGVKILIRGIDRIDSEKQSCFADIWMGAYTCENGSATRAFQATYSKAHKAKKFDHRVQRPSWHLTLLKTSDQQYGYIDKGHPVLRRFNDGTYYERQQIQCNLRQQLHLMSFPYDKQMLTMEFSLETSTRYAVFDTNRDRISIDTDTTFSFAQETEWEFDIEKLFYTVKQEIYPSQVPAGVAGCSSDADPHPNEAVSYSRLTIHIPITRVPTVYILSVMAPLCAVGLAVCIGFSMRSISPGDRLQYLCTLLLTLFALKWSCFESLPKISYTCFLDVVIVASYVYVLISMIICVCVDKDIKTGMLCYIAETAVFVAGIASALLYFKHQDALKKKYIPDSERYYIKRSRPDGKAKTAKQSAPPYVLVSLLAGYILIGFIDGIW